MFKTLRAVLNNINESKYLKIRSNIRYCNPDTYYGDKLDKSDIDVDANIRETERLQTEVRHNNLQVFTTNFAIAKGKQFAVYTLPSLLVALNIALWVFPVSRTATDKLPAYKVVETVLTEEAQLDDYTNGKTYYSSFLGRDFVEETDEDLETSTNDILYFQIRDELDGFLAKISIDGNGKLSLESVDEGKFIDLNDYDFTDAKDLDKKYVNLFDEVIELLNDSSYINKEGKERLLAMADNEKRDILVRIVEYHDLGEMNVDVVKNNWSGRIIFFIIAAIYIWILGYLRYDNGGPFVSDKLYSKDGELVKDYNDEEGLLFLGLKYKAAFLKAEQDRLNKLYDLYFKTLDSSMHPDDIFTTYEKKVLSKQK